MRKFFVPIDGSEFSERAVKEALAQVKAFGGKVVLFNYISADHILASDNIQDMRSAMLDVRNWSSLMTNAEQKSYDVLEKAKAVLEGYDVEIATASGPANKIAHHIVEYAEKNDFDMIIMGSRGVGALKMRLYMGSVTTKVLHQTILPVLIVQ
ncbi:MAG TPA: universal stress protein [Clostridiales bacterium]|jgi:nucleotide-binding universal stress UspA family protein|nr:universal stress protein [Clostridiales bacterium]